VAGCRGRVLSAPRSERSDAGGSMVAVRLPDEAWVGVEAGTEALLERWLVAEGAQVQQGQRIAEIVLVKTTMEVEAPADGVLSRILVAQEDTFGPQQTLAEIV
jgi:pyruvate/2-oxoglutarate dehydrogenase complex dihydrolipoamide acyltransferase (E2) component